VAASTALAATTLSGTYQTKITGKGAYSLKGGLDGTWTINVTKGKYTVKLNGKSVIKGKDVISGSHVTLTDTSGPFKCKGTGKYSFKLSGKSLTFKKIRDTAACVGRADVLAHKFTKVV
jgi:hypothetical protein